MNAPIPEHIIDEIRDRNDIVEVISAHVRLKKKGRNYFGLCPFHTEKTASFSVSPDKQIFHCFGCGTGGNVFRFVMELDKIGFVEAARTLAERAGVTLPRSRADAANVSANDELYRACQFAREYFHNLLVNDERARAARAYVEQRGIGSEIIQRFRLGYAIPGWDNLLGAAGRRSLSPDLLEEAGLAIERKEGGHYDRFRDRLIFPIATASGRTIGFGGRALAADAEPKYLNSPETPIYRKGSALYGLHQARDAIRKAGYALLVEGYMDALRLFEAGIENVVACAGTALTEQHARLLARYAAKVVLVYDADTAGRAAAVRSADVIASANMDGEVAVLPQGHDPDSLVQEQGANVLRRLVDSATPVLDYKLRVLSASQPLEKVEAKRRVIFELAETLAKVTEPVRRSLYVADLAGKLGVGESVVREAVAESAKRRGRPGRAGNEEQKAPRAGAPRGVERDLIRLMLGRPHVVAQARSEVKPGDFTDDGYRKIAQAVFRAFDEGRTPDAATVMDRCESGLADLLSELATEKGGEEEADEMVKGHIRKLKWDRLNRELEQVHAKLRQAQQEGDEGLVAELMQASHRVNMEKRSLGHTQENA